MLIKRMKSANQRSMAFTLIELLVVIAIISLLMSILGPAIGKARKLAKEVRGTSNLRQMLIAYTCYHTDNDGRVLYGYQPTSVNGITSRIRDRSSGHTFGAPVVNRYPWRLSPYVEDVWGVFFSHTKPSQRPSADDSPADAFMKAYMLSIRPTFGLNSIYVGGHFSPFYKGFIDDGQTARPNHGKHAVFQASEVRHPAQLLVFADSRMRNGGAVDNGEDGLFYVTPPRAAGRQWRTVNGEFEILERSRLVGLPQGRYSKQTITGFFDGHVKGHKPEQLDDMRLWANKANSDDYDIPAE